MDLLDFARGPAIELALAAFVLGTVWRLVAILLLPWRPDRSQARDGAPSKAWGALTGIARRFWPHRSFVRAALFSTVNGYVFHIGLALVVLGLGPHILFIRDLTGLSWPALPSNIVYGIAVITLASLAAALIRRLTNPVQRLISTADDSITWAVTTLPVVTGLAATAHIGADYRTLLGVHILSVALFFIWFPFGKLMHTFLFLISRGATGARLVHRGARV
jgi:nitrate reductase gamma subunit